MVEFQVPAEGREWSPRAAGPLTHLKSDQGALQQVAEESGCPSGSQY